MKDLFKPIYNEKYFIYLNTFDIYSNRYMVNPYGVIYDTYENTYKEPRIHNDYLEVSIRNINNITRSYKVHRLVASVFCYNPVEGFNIVNHKDGNKLNNHYSNLEWCTYEYNSRHAILNGLTKPFTPDQVRGENNINAYLKETDVHIICQELCKGTKYSEISKIIGYESNNKNILDLITKIRSKKLWVHISDQYNIPEKEYRTKATTYNDEFIHKICIYLEKSYQIIEIVNMMNVDISTPNKYNNLYNLISRIKGKRVYKRISDNYNW